MALMAWNPSWNVKVKQIDNQHMKLVDMINELHDSMKVGNDKKALCKIVKGLISYTVYHFADEERMMAFHAYPDMAAHKAAHEYFVKKVLELQIQLKSGQAVLQLGVLIFLKDWFLNHIQGVDIKCSAYLNSKGVN